MTAEGKEPIGGLPIGYFEAAGQSMLRALLTIPGGDYGDAPPEAR